MYIYTHTCTYVDMHTYVNIQSPSPRSLTTWDAPQWQFRCLLKALLREQNLCRNRRHVEGMVNQWFMVYDWLWLTMDFKGIYIYIHAYTYIYIYVLMHKWFHGISWNWCFLVDWCYCSCFIRSRMTGFRGRQHLVEISTSVLCIVFHQQTREVWFSWTNKTFHRDFPWPYLINY